MPAAALVDAESARNRTSSEGGNGFSDRRRDVGELRKIALEAFERLLASRRTRRCSTAALLRQLGRPARRAPPRRDRRAGRPTSRRLTPSARSTDCRLTEISRKPPSVRNATAMVPIDIAAERPERRRVTSASCERVAEGAHHRGASRCADRLRLAAMLEVNGAATRPILISRDRASRRAPSCRSH